MFELYEDQQRDIAALRVLFGQYRCGVYCLPTGGGKTVQAGYLAQRMRKNGLKILILVHRRELVKQFFETLREVGLDKEVSLVCPGYTPIPWAPIQIAMIFSWARRKPIFRPDFIIVDEAHHAKAQSWHTVLEMYPTAKVLGLTATPVRLDGKPLNPPFEAMHCGDSIGTLIQKGRLSPVICKSIPAHRMNQKIKRSSGDYSRKELDKMVDAKVIARAATAYTKYIPGYRTLFFGITKRHAKSVAEELKSLGVRAAYVGDETETAIRADIFARFGEGRLDVVCNVGLVDEGFDVPACNAVMDGRATLSVTKYLQAVGRCLRYQKGKTAVYVDLVGNTYRHGRPDIDRVWSLNGDDNGDPVNPKDKGSNLRVCKACLTLYNKREPQCPSCGHTPTGREIVEVEMELVDILETIPKPPAPPKPKKPPKFTVKERAKVLHESRQLFFQGKPKDAWKIIQDCGIKSGCHPLWAHRMADLIGIKESDRK